MEGKGVNVKTILKPNDPTNNLKFKTTYDALYLWVSILKNKDDPYISAYIQTHRYIHMCLFIYFPIL